jgi:hypothetical protein
VWTWGYSSLLGMEGGGTFRDIEFDPPKRRVAKNRAGLEEITVPRVSGTFIYELENENGGTRVTVVDEIETPGPNLVNKIIDPILAWEFNREQAAMLDNLKTNMENS